MKNRYLFFLYLFIALGIFVFYWWFSVHILKLPYENIQDESLKKIDDRIWELFVRIGFGITILIGILGFFGIKEGQKYVQKYIDDRVKDAYENVSNEQRIFILRYRMKEVMKGAIIEKKLLDLSALFKDALKTQNEELKGEFLDNLIRVYFDKRNYENITKLVREHAKEPSTLSYLSWANFAIANMNDYYSFGAKKNKELAFEGCKNALDMLPAYGTAYAVKLVVLMIDLEKTKNEKDKEKIKKEISEILDEVNSGSIETSSYETYIYLSLHLGSLTKYFDLLVKYFPEQMQNLKLRYDKELSYLESKSNTSSGKAPNNN
ncbi:MAG: hypothetical protein ACHQNT_02625 [Bacteroidia bacterium]